MASYQSARKAKLLGHAAAPPPLPEVTLPQAAGSDSVGFGDAAEDGLLMLAALERMPSLEPDFCDDHAVEEATITIVEHFATPTERSIGRAEDGADLDADEYAAYHGPIEEATVEIVEVRRPGGGAERGRRG